jgi:hypothetical protein
MGMTVVKSREIFIIFNTYTPWDFVANCHANTHHVFWLTAWSTRYEVIVFAVTAKLIIVSKTLIWDGKNVIIAPHVFGYWDHGTRSKCESARFWILPTFVKGSFTACIISYDCSAVFFPIHVETIAVGEICLNTKKKACCA